MRTKGDGLDPIRELLSQARTHASSDATSRDTRWVDPSAWGHFAKLLAAGLAESTAPVRPADPIRECLDGLRKRETCLDSMRDDGTRRESADWARILGKASAYEHAAELLASAIERAEGPTPSTTRCPRVDCEDGTRKTGVMHGDSPEHEDCPACTPGSESGD